MVKLVPNSKVTNQVLGTGIGAVIVGIVVSLTTKPNLTWTNSLLALGSGGFWALGQVGQFISLNKVGVSKAVPISTGFQLIGNTLIGALVFGEWQTSHDYLFGTLAIILLIIGIALTAYVPKKSSHKVAAKDLIFLLVTSMGYWCYSAFPKVVKVNSQDVFLPQMVGFWLGITLYLLFSRQLVAYREKSSWIDTIAGGFWGLGGFIYIIVAQKIGITTAFIFGQQAVVISAICGMTILGEHKSGKELTATILGIIMIVVGAILTV
jgi:glucose uptake protein